MHKIEIACKIECGEGGHVLEIGGVSTGLLIDCNSTLGIGRSPSAHQLLPGRTYPLGRC